MLSNPLKNTDSQHFGTLTSTLASKIVFREKPQSDACRAGAEVCKT